MKKRSFAAGILSLLLLSGCTSGPEASSLTVVTGIGLDGVPGSCRVSAEAIQLTQTQEGGQRVLLHADGVNLTDSIRNTIAITGRQLHSNHAEILIFGRELAEAGLRPVLEDLLRQNQYPVSIQLAVAKGTAEEIMSTQPVVGDIGSMELDTMLKQGEVQCSAPSVTAAEFYQQACAPGMEPILPFVELRQNGDAMVREITGCALFRDMTLLSILDGQESRTLMWMRGKSGGTLVGDGVVFEMQTLKRTLSVSPEGGRMHLTVQLRTDGDPLEEEALYRQAKMLLEQQCELVLSLLQEQKCDALGIGNALYRKSPKRWETLKEDWPERFASYPLQIEITIEEIRWGRLWTERSVEQWEENIRGE